MEKIDKCPKCGEEKNLHFNYDWSKEHTPIDDVLCNECGEIFKGDTPVKEKIIYVPLLDIPENEIERAAADAFDTATARLGFTYGVEWYKQQLKNKQI